MYEVLLLLTVSLLSIWLIYNQLGSTHLPTKSRQSRRSARLWSQAQRQIKQANFKEAEKLLLTILNIDEQHAAAYNALGILYAKQKEYTDAIACFNAAFNIETSANALHNLGLVYLNLEQYEKAAIALKQALELDDQSALRHVEYSKALERLGRHKEMLQALEKAAEIDSSPDILKTLLKAYKSRDMPDKVSELENKINQSEAKTATVGV